ncbi:hypothetical protein SDC9_168546 [bioreactor metagenome]|uniref:Uncharacterized protein n=1 Tax=bioreactor metagenome TaxID=1076179 RepID=A0A645G2S5_9ZZZZ
MPPAQIIATTGNIVTEISPIHMYGKDRLTHIAQTGGPLAPFLGIGKSRKKHCRQNGDNGNDNEQFDQGKCPAASNEFTPNMARVNVGHNLA